MKIGLPKEIKDNEYRVGLTPAGVQALGERRARGFRAKDGGRRLGLSRTTSM